MKPHVFVNKLDEKKIVGAIATVERETSGEIRVFVSHHATNDPVRAAQRQFARLRMDRTHARNGVLLFFAPLSRAFSVVGDVAIHEKCGDEFWVNIAERMKTKLK